MLVQFEGVLASEDFEGLDNGIRLSLQLGTRDSRLQLGSSERRASIIPRVARTIAPDPAGPGTDYRGATTRNLRAGVYLRVSAARFREP